MKPGLKIIKLSLHMYKSMVTNLNSKIESGVGDGFYIKEYLDFNVRHSLGKINESIEILWIEFQDRNKNTSVLIGVVFQPS